MYVCMYVPGQSAFLQFPQSYADKNVLNHAAITTIH